MIASTFPDFSEQEALGELCPAYSDASPSAVGEASPMLRGFDGRLAGWISAPRGDHRGSCMRSFVAATENGTLSSCDGPNLTASSCANGVTEEARGSGGDSSCDGNGESRTPHSCGLCDRQPPVCRELTSSRHVRRGDIVAVERPVAALQTSEAMPWVVACPGCLRHVGSLDVQLAIASNKVSRAEAFEEFSSRINDAWHQQQSGETLPEQQGLDKGLVDRLPPVAGVSERFTQSPVPCAAACGAIYCSDACRTRCWDLGHSLLCLGLAEDENHPLVRHKLHAFNHPELEAPLLLASQLLVQAAVKITSERLTQAPASSEPSNLHAVGASPHSAPAPIDDTVVPHRPPAPPVTVGFAVVDDCDVEGCHEDCKAEAVAARILTEALFPRGRFREESDRAPPAAIVRESWALLVEALTAATREKRDEKKLDQGVVAVGAVIDPAEFPLLLGERLHADVVGGMAANLLDVEVQSPLVEYGEALVTQSRPVQRQALQVLEPALRAMETDDVEDNSDVDCDSDSDAYEPPLSEGSSTNAEDAASNFKVPSRESPAAKRCDIDDPHSSGHRLETLAENRTSARLAWRCLDFARAAARVMPPLSAKVLLPAAVLRLPHSCAPVIKVPAGDPRSYRRDDGAAGDDARFPTAGAPGWPLSVAAVALRDIPAGAQLACSWVDAEQRQSVRMARLRDYGEDATTAAVMMPSAHDADHRGLCGCSKCRVEVAAGQDEGGTPGISPLGTKGLLEAARLAFDEDRFDDAADALRRAARLSPYDGDVLYGAGVCAINQGQWSRALRLWREGLALSPDHSRLKHEADRYRALAFWLGTADVACQDTVPFSYHPPLQQLPAAGSNHSGGRRDRACDLKDSLDVTFMAGGLSGAWVCKTRDPPPLSRAECASVIQEAEETAVANGDGWGTARHYAVPTTDIAVRDLPRTLAWFNSAMHERIAPLVAAAAALGRGEIDENEFSSTSRGMGHTAGATARDDRGATEVGAGEDVVRPEDAFDAFVRRLRVHDAFVVRYDAAAQRSLPLHTDQAELSLTISLNGGDEYEGGGTWFEGLGRAVRPPDPGHVLVFPGGDTMHGGREITSGVRYILAVFLYEHHREEEEDEEEGEEGDVLGISY